MISFPNAKINIGLHVTGKREDGYHNIETLFYPVKLADILEITPLPEASGSNIFKCTGNMEEIPADDNLCMLALKKLRSVVTVPYVKIHLHKIIPSGAGLGGGSSDAASVLKSLNELFTLNLSLSDLAIISAGIGSDCPFFIYNTPLLARGRGDIFESIDIDLTGIEVIVVYPGINVSTAGAYKAVKVKTHPEPLISLLKKPPEEWNQFLVNDFEMAVFKRHPEIAAVKDKLIASGAFYSAMTGSGSAVYGLYHGNSDLVAVKEMFKGMFVYTGRL